MQAALAPKWIGSKLEASRVFIDIVVFLYYDS